MSKNNDMIEADNEISKLEQVPESKNKAKNDAKRAAKLEKLAIKLAKAGETKTIVEADASTKSNISKKISSKLNVPFINTVPYGEKKDISGPLANGYDPLAVESAWYSWWQKCGFFKPEYSNKDEYNKNKKPFSIVMPPPNVTGSLHIGHAMMIAIEDTIVRWRRMCGDSVLYLPGCDHAGIATQSVVEKKLQKDSNLTRHDLGRDAFVSEIWKWKEQHGDRIYEQIRRMGASADWDRRCFTLDPQLNKAVVESFIRMFNDGLIFRSNRLVNWCGKLQTSLSDLEVDKMEIEGLTMLPAFDHPKDKLYKFGLMTYIAYPVDGCEGEEIVIGTTRPETVFGDTALCVNPKDARYILFHGKNVRHPVTDELIPIICDEAADPEFGTGALKVSPAHDPIDFALAQKHNLRFLAVFDKNNRLNEKCGVFSGMARYEAREAVVELVKKKGLFRDEKPNPMTIPVCSRSGDFVEPRLIPQWWLDCKEMASKSVAAVRNGELNISPKEYEKTWYHWLENIKDWCISRQLWWGHRIPAYRVLLKNDSTDFCSREEIWVAARSEEEALVLACETLPNIDKENINVIQDEDVLDTWFSSALWPFSTLGWPDEESSDFQKYFPNQLLETGSDIIFFWVARMVMMSLHLTGKLPFSNVFLHAIVRDAHGRKMSKSLGNVIDPIDVIQGIDLELLQSRLDQGNLSLKEIKIAKDAQKRDFPNGIPQCGTDALRFGLCSYVAEGRDINMDINRIEGYRRFCNKIWNACRFALMKLGDGYEPLEKSEIIGGESLVDKWVLLRLNQTIKEVNEALEIKNLMIATQSIYSFWLYDLCDVYIEAIKPVCSDNNKNLDSKKCASNALYICLEEGLRMLHPFMPFVTEELYQHLPRRPQDKIPSISVSPFPTYHEDFKFFEAESQFNSMYEVIKNIRRLASETKINKKSEISLQSPNQKSLELISANEMAIGSLLKSVGNLSINCDEDIAPDSIPIIDTDLFVSFSSNN